MTCSPPTFVCFYSEPAQIREVSLAVQSPGQACAVFQALCKDLGRQR